MKSSHLIITFFIIIFSSNMLLSQEESFDLYVIDAYVTPEKPYTFIISFFTSEEVKSKIEIDERYEAEISSEFTEDHSAEVNFTNYKFSEKYIPYKIYCERKSGEIIESETFELILPYEEFIETKEGEDPISTILFGFFLYLLPAPNMIITDYDEYFSLTKEFPIITFYSSGYTNPSGNLSLEYTHVYESSINNYLRIGYKHFFPTDVIEYISPGLTGFTNFNGFNGVGAEVSLGLFNIYDVFTIYSRYRYNFKPNQTDQRFHEVSLGIYSHFFTIDF